MSWAQTQRQNFISEKVEKEKQINRKDLILEFGISMPQASVDLRIWQENNPEKIKYNLKLKRYEKIEAQNKSV